MFLRVLTCVALTALAATSTLAQDWPTQKPIRIVVPYPPGGNADAAARAIAEVVSKHVAQTIVIDNRPGASSIIGTDAVARAQPDGYTIGVVSDSHAINHAMAAIPKASDTLGARPPYDAVRDFLPVAGMIEVPLVLAVAPGKGIASVRELVAQSAAGKGISFGTMGPGSPWAIHLHQLNALTGARFTDVPYRGLAPAATDLIGGQIDTMLMPVHYALQYTQSDKLVPLATLGAQRHPLMPAVPTLAEAGYPGLEIANLLYFVAPAGTPQPVIERLSSAINQALAEPDMAGKLSASGDPYPAQPAQLAERLLRDIEAYGAVIGATMQ